jgi:hypothetical protein
MFSCELASMGILPMFLGDRQNSRSFPGDRRADRGLDEPGKVTGIMVGTDL